MTQPKPKKSYGQNFLTSTAARAHIIEAGEISQSDTILEIGPGRGFLTEALLATGATVLAVEKDKDLIPYLHDILAERPNLKLEEGDALTFTPPEHYKLIANIPYYITGAIFEYYLSATHQPERMVVLIQKEVADRICAKDGKHSILSLSVWCYGTPRIVTKVGRGSFNPAPNVDSAVICISSISRKNFDNQYHEAMYFKIIKAGFAHKRKYLISNLSDITNHTTLEEIFHVIGLSPKVRSEDVTLLQWMAISRSLCSKSSTASSR